MISSSRPVLLRIPDVSPGAKPVKAPAEVETYVQKPLQPLTTAPSSEPRKPASEKRSTPAELHSNRFKRPLVVLAGVAVLAVLAVAFARRNRPAEPDPLPPEIAAQVAASNVPGGSPAEITQIPEISFPTEPLPPVSTESGSVASSEASIQRLPAVGQPSETASAVPSEAAGNTPDTDAQQRTAVQPGVARLDLNIAQPQPQASHDSTRSGLY